MHTWVQVPIESGTGHRSSGAGVTGCQEWSVGIQQYSLLTINRFSNLLPPIFIVTKTCQFFHFYVCECFASMFICASDMPVLEEVVSLYLGLGDNPTNPLQQLVFLITEPTLQSLSFKFSKAFLLQLDMVVHSLNLSTWERGQPSPNSETLCKNKKPSIAVHKPFQSQHLAGRSRLISEFEPSLAYIVSRETARGIL